MNNRDRIIEAALQLFNQRGVRNVTVRDICRELEISPGNFNYHFPGKELIIKSLYERLNEEIDTAISNIPLNQTSVRYFLETHRQIFFIQHKYKFFYLNLFEILTNFPEIKKTFQQRYQLEKQMARFFMELYVEKGVLLPNSEANTFDRIINTGLILNNAWLMDAEINFSANMQEKLLHYMQLCCGRLEPLLSEAAKEEYFKYFEDIKRDTAKQD